MYKLSVTNYRGEALSLTENKKYTVQRIDGLNPPQASVSQSSNATQDGSNINNVRVEQRNIVLYIVPEGNIEANRINLYKYFPIKKEVTLYYSNDSRDVYIKGVVELIECDYFANKQVVQVSLICPKPYFRAVNELVTAFGEVNDLFEFPFSISAEGIEFSNITSNPRKSIVNTGDVDTGVLIELHASGTVVKPIIYSVLDSKHFTLNMTLNAGDTVLINTNIGEKSVTLIRESVVSNALGYMERDSTWFTLTSGDNVFTYDAESGETALHITFTTPILYGGV